MRTLLQHPTIAVALLAVVFAVMLASSQMGLQAKQAVYPLMRMAAKEKHNFETRAMKVRETQHYVIKYREDDAAVVDMVATAAEAAYQPVTSMFGYTISAKTIIVIYHDRRDLNKAFGWSGDESAMGAYWGGVIQLLSPRAWMKDGDSIQEFVHAGPMVHELTHLVFDHMTNGNYPRWFTEGLAQYVEYRVNGYEWKTTTNSLNSGLYTQEQLDANFDDLPNQSLAYRESLGVIRYIAEVYGQDKLDGIIAQLRAGRPLEQAISRTLGMNYQTFAAEWPKWAKNNM